MIRRLFGWVSKLFGRKEQPPPRSRTIVDRWLQGLPNVEVDRAFCALVAQLELDLRLAGRRLVELDLAELPGLRAEAGHLAGEIRDFLREPDGQLAVAIRHWPPPVIDAHGTLGEAAEAGNQLLGAAVGLFEFAEEFKALRSSTAELRDQYAAVVPQEWGVLGQPLLEYLEGVNDRSGLTGYRDQVASAGAILRAQVAALTDLRAELLQRCGVEAGENSRETDLEAAVAELVTWVEARSKAVRNTAVSLVDREVEAHLRHTGLKRPDLGVVGKRPGTAERGLARWRQLRRVSRG